MMLIAGMLYHGLSDHARMREKLDSSNPLVNDELMLCILVDSIVAVLDSPVSVPAQRLLHEHHEEGPG
jgi:hypothetical protein